VAVTGCRAGSRVRDPLDRCRTPAAVGVIRMRCPARGPGRPIR